MRLVDIQETCMRILATMTVVGINGMVVDLAKYNIWSALFNIGLLGFIVSAIWFCRFD